MRRLHVEGKKILDGLGREVRLRGINIRTWLLTPETITDFADLQKIESWGFNSVRVWLYWQFAMPNEGVIDEGYFRDHVDNYVDWCEQLGLYCILDWHQSGFSDFFTYGYEMHNGHPAWSLHDAYPNDAGGVAQAQRDFWHKNHPQEKNQQYLIDTIAYMMNRYRDKPHIILSPFNEPNMPYCDSLPTLAPLYKEFMENCIDQVRAVEAFPHIVFAQNIYDRDDIIYMQDIDRANVAWNYHIYIWKSYDRDTDYADLKENWFDLYTNQYLSFNKPVVVTEFNAYKEGYLDWLSDLLELMESRGLGWCYMRYDKGIPDPPQDKLSLLQTYLPAPIPPKGYLKVKAYQNSTEVAASVEVVGVGTYTTPFSLELDPGTYSINATYDTQKLGQTAPILDGQTTTVEFRFSIPPEPPPEQPPPETEPVVPLFPRVREKLYPIAPRPFDRFDEWRGEKGLIFMRGKRFKWRG